MKFNFSFRAFFLPLIVLMTLVGIATWGTLHWSVESLQEEARSRLERQLEINLSLLENTLKGFDLLPGILSHEAPLLALLKDPTSPVKQRTANLYLKQFRGASESAAAYLMNTEGTTLAASNFGEPKSFVGKNDAFQPYFQQALNGKTGRYAAMGVTSNVRGYYIARRIVENRRTLGVAVVKTDIGALEKAWEKQREILLVSNRDG